MISHPTQHCHGMLHYMVSWSDIIHEAIMKVDEIMLMRLLTDFPAYCRHQLVTHVLTLKYYTVQRFMFIAVSFLDVTYAPSCPDFFSREI